MEITFFENMVQIWFFKTPYHYLLIHVFVSFLEFMFFYKYASHIESL